MFFEIYIINFFFSSIDAYDQVVKMIQNDYCSSTDPPVGLCGSKNLFNGYCFPIVRDQFIAYPGFSFILENNVNITLLPQNYLYKNSSKLFLLFYSFFSLFIFSKNIFVVLLLVLLVINLE